MFKKKNQAEQSFKEKKIGTIKVGTHKKTVIVLWVVLIASMSFGVYKNFTAIDMHTVHETEGGYEFATIYGTRKRNHKQ